MNCEERCRRGGNPDRCHHRLISSPLVSPSAAINRKGKAGTYGEVYAFRFIHTRSRMTTGPCTPTMPGTSIRGGGYTQFVHGRSRMTIDHRIPTMPGPSTSGFHQPGRYCRGGRGYHVHVSLYLGDMHEHRLRSLDVRDQGRTLG